VSTHLVERSGRCAAMVVLLGAALALPGCGAGRAEHVQPRLSEWLTSCSPFRSFDGESSLTFDAVGKATLAPWHGSKKRKRAAAVEGRWIGDEAGLALSLSLPNRPRTFYVLSLPAAEEHCILVPGPQGNADLRLAWFGFPPVEDDE